MMRVYIKRVSDNLNISFLSDNIKKHCNSYNDLNQRNMSLNAYVLLTEALKKDYKIDKYDIEFINGKPFITNSNIHISISHSGRYVAVGISYKNIGIDIQKEITDVRLADRILTMDEKKKDIDKEYLSKKWVLKEAYAKYKGTSIFDVLKESIDDYTDKLILDDVYYLGIYGDSLEEVIK